MLKAEVNGTNVVINFGKTGVEALEDILMLLASCYNAFESAEKGAGDEMLQAVTIACAIGEIRRFAEGGESRK